MNRILQQSVIPFLKQYWWMWLSLLVASIIIMIIGPSVVGGFIFNVFRFLFFGSLFFFILAFIGNYTIGRGIIGIWGLMRVVGVCGILWCSAFLIEYVKDLNKYVDVWTAERLQLNLSDIFHTTIFLALSLMILGLGELLLYLHKINYKLKQQLALPKKNEMLCPRCVGKGFVDGDDIRRLDMGDDWLPGSCQYCDAQGYVERGNPQKKDPTRFDSFFDLWGAGANGEYERMKKENGM